MYHGKFNTQREDSIFLTLYHLLHGSNTAFTSTIGCRSFQTGVTVFQVYLFTCVFQHMFQGLLIVRSHLQTRISRSRDCKKMFQVFQTLTFARYNSTEAFATGSTAKQHSDVTVRLFQSDTRVMERARLNVGCLEIPFDFMQISQWFVLLSVTVDLVSKFLFRCPRKSEFRRRQVTSTQCTQFTLERLESRFMVDKVMALISQLFLTRIDRKSRLPQR